MRGYATDGELFPKFGNPLFPRMDGRIDAHVGHDISSADDTVEQS